MKYSTVPPPPGAAKPSPDAEAPTSEDTPAPKSGGKKMRRKKRGFINMLSNAFNAGTLLALAGVTQLPEKMPEVCPAFTEVADTDMTRNHLDGLIAGINAQGSITDIALIIGNDAYAHERGYYNAGLDHVAIGQENAVIRRIKWDLRILNLYEGNSDAAFNDGLARAITAFQGQNNLERTGQPDQETLNVLADKAHSQRVLIGFHALRTAEFFGEPDIYAAASELFILLDAESEGNPFAEAGSSSAVGIAQITETTALDIVARLGNRLGYDAQLIADARRILQLEALSVLNGEQEAQRIALQPVRQRIMDMRLDMAQAIPMAYAYVVSNNDGVFSAERGYGSFVLGATGQRRLLNNPHGNAVSLLPGSAEANKSLFFREKVDGVWRGALQGFEVLTRIRERVLRADRVQKADNVMEIARNMHNTERAAACMPDITAPAPATGA